MILENLRETDEINYGQYFVRTIYNASEYQNNVFTPHWHEYCEIVLVHSGALNILYNNTSLCLYPGDLFFFGENKLHSGISDKKGCVYHAIQFKWSDIFTDSAPEKQLHKLLSEGIYTIKSPIHDDTVSELYTKIIEVCEGENVSRPFAERTALFELLTYLFDNYLEKQYIVPKSNGKSNEFDEILRFIHNNYLNVTPKEIADEFSYNQSYISRLFKRKMNLTLTEYLNLCKIEHSQILIRKNELSLSEIAQQCGYSNYSYFSLVFKKIVGMSPIDWKAQYINDK